MSGLTDYQLILGEAAHEELKYGGQTVREAQSIAADARRKVTRKGSEFTADITKKWKDGFKALKDENDQMQKDLKQAHIETDLMITQWLKDRIAEIKSWPKD